MIKSEFLIKTGMVWSVSSDKWKAPLYEGLNGVVAFTVIG